MTALRRTQLARFGVWIGLATVAVLIAVLAARTETGVRRIAGLLAPPRPAGAQREGTGSADRQAPFRPGGRTAPAERGDPHARGRPRPAAARVNTLERSLEDVTGSIGPAGKAPQLPGIPGAPPPAPAAAAPAPPANAVSRAGRRRPARIEFRPATWRPASRRPRNRSRPRPSSASISAAIRRSRAADAVVEPEGEPVRDARRAPSRDRDPRGPRPGSIELRLIAGPLANASIAARLCAALAAAGQTCQPTVFDGQRLALQ